MSLQEREMIERLSCELVRLRSDVQKLIASNKALTVEHGSLHERLCDANKEIERLETRALRVALSSIPAPPVDDAEEPGDEDEREGGDEPDYDAPTQREQYQEAWAESRSLGRWR